MRDLPELDERTARFYSTAMAALNEAEIPFLVGGAYAFACYTGVTRHTKDLDLFLTPSNLDPALQALHDEGYETEVTFPHWLAKAHEGDASIDLIFASGNGLWHVDGSWFERSVDDHVLGVPAKLCSAEETILMKAFIMERERFDGADVAHLLRECSTGIDWDHLLKLFGPHWEVLYGHLIFFGYIYPSRRHHVPESVMRELSRRLQEERSQPFEEEICRGTLLSRAQYLTDVEQLGFKDGRELPVGSMTQNEISDWTAAIEKDE